MIKRILHIVTWLVILGWFIIIMGFVSNKSNDLLCKRMVITISDSTNVKFITADKVRSLVSESDIDIQGYPISQINTRRLENIIEGNSYVMNAEAYTTITGELFIDIEQRMPIVRIMPGGRQGYYIDNTGNFLPLSPSYTPMVLLVTGNVNIPASVREEGLMHPDSVEAQYRYLIEILEFAKYIDTHPFWKGQIVQLYRNNSGEYEIIPRIGAHQILFGTMDNYREKLRNLRLLYDQGFQKYGWNNYSKINLKYSNQVICTKR